MRKKMIALLMALSMVPALAACGSSNNTGNNTSESATEAQTGETTAAQETEVQSQEETKAETKAEAPALSGTMKVVDYQRELCNPCLTNSLRIPALRQSCFPCPQERCFQASARRAAPPAALWFWRRYRRIHERKGGRTVRAGFLDASADLAEEFKDPEGYWYSKGITIVGFLINDGLMGGAQYRGSANWDDLLKAEYEGEIIMSNPAVSGTNYAVVNALLQAKR